MSGVRRILVTERRKDPAALEKEIYLPVMITAHQQRIVPCLAASQKPEGNRQFPLEFREIAFNINICSRRDAQCPVLNYQSRSVVCDTAEAAPGSRILLFA